MLRRVSFYFNLIVDMCRILEVTSRWVPEVFLTKDLINMNRLLEYIFFVLKSLFKMDLGPKMEAYCERSPSRTQKIEMFLAPFIGILSNI
jgi:hypothetical protein